MFKNRVRLPFYLSKPQFPVEKNVFRKADGSSKLISAVIRNTYEGETDYLPEDWHRKLIIALAHDEVTVEGMNLLTDVVLDGEYEIDWQRFLNYPVAPSKFTVQVTPFDASNSNCQSCAEITQLELVDDYTDEIWDEGTTHEFPDLLTANDIICCYPFLIELMNYNTLYFENVTVDSTGVLTATVKADVPILNDVLLATYRVTCENGGYDEANVYVNITGTSTECPPPTNLQVSQTPGDSNIYVTWTEPTPGPAGGYDWDLYLTGDLFTPVQSGNVPTGGALTINGSGLIYGYSYTFVITSLCGAYDESAPVSTIFNVANFLPADTCGNFSVTYLPVLSEGLQSASYIDCNGDVQNYVFTGAGSTELCMLITFGTETPIFFAASTSEITLTYIDLC